MKYILLMTLFIQTAMAQVYVSQDAKTNLKFQGTLIQDTFHNKGAIAVREVNGKQTMLLVLEVNDFILENDFQKEEFHEVFMETQYFPQIRLTGDFKEKIDLTKNGSYAVTFIGRLTIRMRPIATEIKAKLVIKDSEMTITFDKEIDLIDYQIAYAGEGSSIGRFARFIFDGKLQRTF